MPDIEIVEKLYKTVQIIEQLSGGAERRLLYDEILNIIDSITENYLFSVFSLKQDLCFYRGRITNKENKFSNTKEMTIRKAKDIKSYGRCHSPNRRILYASTNIETVLSELQAKSDDYVQIIKIKIKPSKQVSHTVIGEIDHVRRHGRTSFWNEEAAKGIKDHWRSLSELEKLKLNLADAFLADKFRTPVKAEYEYKTTAAFSEIVFKQSQSETDIESFLYPSVSHLGGWNIAIDGDVFESKFEVVESSVIHVVQALKYGIYKTAIKSKSEQVNDNEIIWDERNRHNLFISFDDFLWQEVNKPPLRVFHFITIKFLVNVENKDLSTVAGDIPDGQAGIEVKFLPFHIFANTAITYPSLVKKIDENDKNWQMLGVIPRKVLKLDEVEKITEKIRNDISSSKVDNLVVFDRYGRNVPFPFQLFQMTQNENRK